MLSPSAALCSPSFEPRTVSCITHPIGMAEFDAALVRANRLLASLPVDDFNRIAVRLESVALKRAETLYEPDAPIEYVYFPTGALISLVASMRDGTVVEVAVIGREGMVGLPLAFGSETSSRKVITQVPGPRAAAVGGHVLRGDSPRQRAPRSAQALHDGAPDTDDAVGGVQQASLAGTASRAVAARKRRRDGYGALRAHAGLHRADARRAPAERDRDRALVREAGHAPDLSRPDSHREPDRPRARRVRVLSLRRRGRSTSSTAIERIEEPVGRSG